MDRSNFYSTPDVFGVDDAVFSDGENYEELPLPSPGMEEPDSPIDQLCQGGSTRIPYISIYSSPARVFMNTISSGYLSGTPITLKFLNASKEAAFTHPLNPYLYTIEVTHGQFRWIIYKRFKHLRELHDRLWMVRTGYKIPLPSKSHKRKRRTVKEFTKRDPKLPRFPKRPDVWVSSELIDKRMKQLEDYLNAVLTSPLYRKHHLMKMFLEVSRFSFIQDLGIKGKEGVLKKKSGGHKINLYFCDKCCNLKCRELLHSWNERWFVVKDSFLMYFKPEEQKVKGVILFDQGFCVEWKENSTELAISNSSRRLTVKCWTQRQTGVWHDAILETVNRHGADFVKPNQFGSFAPSRHASLAHWFVDGSSYFSSVAEAIENAREEIFITDWWLSPQIYLKRPTVHGDKWQLDKLLKRKADNGVKIYILLYKEVEMAVALQSRYAKDILQDHNKGNIRVLRHPDHITATADSLLWAHHEKIVVIDQSIAYVGGIDLCYGRWDNHEHRLTDVGSGKENDVSEDVPDGMNVKDTPTPKASHVFKAFQAMTVAVVEEVSKDFTDGGTLKSLASRDLSSVKLSSASDVSDQDQVDVFELHPELNHTKKMNMECNLLLPNNAGAGYGSMSFSDTLPLLADSPASHGSGQWTTNAGKDYRGMVESIKKVGHSKLWIGKDYCNFVMKDLANLDAPYEDHIDRKVSPRMPWHDIACVTYGKPARDAARHFIQRWNFTKVEKAKKGESVPFLLPKSYDDDTFSVPPQMIHSGAVSAKIQILRSCSEWSAGLVKPEFSIQTAYIDAINKAEHFIYIENQFFISVRNDPNINNKIVDALYFRILRAHNEKKKFRVYVVMPLIPGFEGDISDSSKSVAIQAIMYWQYRSMVRGEGSLLGDLMKKVGNQYINYVSFCGLRAHSELGGKPITEIVYVHSKMLIVDDLKAIIGSANINDRSMTGVRDSEVAMYIEDTEFVDSIMDEKPCKVGKFAFHLRKRVFAEHLGLLPDDFIESSFEPTENIDDVVCDKFFKDMWLKVAGINTTVYEKVFKCVPSDSVHSFAGISAYQTNQSISIAEMREKLQKIRGFLVLLPLYFLKDEVLRPDGLNKEGLAPTAVWT